METASGKLKEEDFRWTGTIYKHEFLDQTMAIQADLVRMMNDQLNMQKDAGHLKSVFEELKKREILETRKLEKEDKETKRLEQIYIKANFKLRELLDRKN